ncbi:hypothetical protein VB005_06758 [Metarhizium brunneum]
MPPFNGDSNYGSTPLAMLDEGIRMAIRNPLQRLHKQELPTWYPDIEAALIKLIQLGTKISKYSQAFEPRRKLIAVADAIPHFDSIYSAINTQLIRNTRDCITSRLDRGNLSLILALVDGWLRSCEEYIRKEPSIRVYSDISAFEDAHKELITAATQHTSDGTHVPDDLLRLFDGLGLIKALDS